MRSFRLLALVLVGVAAMCSAAEEPGTNAAPVFRAVDVYVDSQDKPLAAYQLEFTAPQGSVKIVGIEGGEHRAFTNPPAYDPKAMQNDRVILAAFSTNAVRDLPVGRTRVATIHVQAAANAPVDFSIRLGVAADPEGTVIRAKASVQERKTPYVE